jgi:hypothetical protein
VQECRWCLEAIRDWDDYRTWELSPSAVLFFHIECFRAWTRYQEVDQDTQSQWIAQFYRGSSLTRMKSWA